MGKQLRSQVSLGPHVHSCSDSGLLTGPQLCSREEGRTTCFPTWPQSHFVCVVRGEGPSDWWFCRLPLQPGSGFGLVLRTHGVELLHSEEGVLLPGLDLGFLFYKQRVLFLSPLRCKSLIHWTSGRKKPPLWSPSQDRVPGGLHNDEAWSEECQGIAWAFLCVNWGITHGFGCRSKLVLDYAARKKLTLKILSKGTKSRMVFSYYCSFDFNTRRNLANQS